MNDMKSSPQPGELENFLSGEEHEEKIKNNDEFIVNVYHNKEYLTKSEALHLLNHITAVLLIHECS